MKGGGAARQYCARCVSGNDPRGALFNRAPEEVFQFDLPFNAEGVILYPTLIGVVDVSDELVRRLLHNYDEIYDLSSERFEDLIQNRICAMGYEASRVGHTFHKDGGLDILFWPSRPCSIPFLGAVQVKHHRSHDRKTGAAPIREMAGIMNSQPLQVGMVVTNTSFTADAKWFVNHHRAIIRLRDMHDLKRWIAENFTDDAEWREMPDMLELAPGVTIDLSDKRGSP
jgi:hypothetical protein